VPAELTNDEILARLRTICLALPETRETLTWGHPHFRAGDKIFCSFSDGEGATHRAITLKTGMEMQGVFLNDPRFFKPAYVGNKGWISLNCDAAPLHWEEIAELVKQSYRLIAPKRLARLVP
jgi:predicted DNA-binding protein (MmcQ/YjbR family)